MNKKPLSFAPGGEPDSVDLELQMLGDVSDAQEIEALRAAAKGPLQETEAELQAFQEFWKKAPALMPKPPDVVLAPVVPLRRDDVLPIAVSSLVAAAVLLAFVFLGLVGTTTDPSPHQLDGIRAMGSLPVDLTVRRDGLQVEPVRGAFAAGDVLGIALVPPKAGVLSLGILGQDGRVELLWRSGKALPAGQRFVLDDGLKLDENMDREWLFLVVHEPGEDEAAVAAGLRKLLPDPDALNSSDGVWLFDVTRQDRP